MSPVWHHHIRGLHPLKVAYQDGRLTFEESRDQHVAILRASPCYSKSDALDAPWTFSGLVDELATAANVPAFDEVLSFLYAECDRNRIWLDPVS